MIADDLKLTSPSQSSADISQLTSLTLLERLRGRERDGWFRFCRIYGPLVYAWGRNAGLQSADAADVVQDVFLVVARRIHEFQRLEQRNFRNWLWTICHNILQAWYRRLAQHPRAEGGSSAQLRLTQLHEYSASFHEVELSDRIRVVLQVLSVLQEEVSAVTWQVFWRTAVGGEEAQLIASEFGLTRWAVYKIKARLLQRIRQEIAGLISLDQVLDLPVQMTGQRITP